MAYVRLDKISSVNGGVPAGDPAIWQYGASGNTTSIPVGYWLFGEMSEVHIGEPVVIARDVRCGVRVAGVFRSTPVTAVEGNTFRTGNSVYRWIPVEKDGGGAP
jgi:hypothetical protein